MRRISLAGVTLCVASIMAATLSFVAVSEASPEEPGQISRGSTADPDSPSAVAAQKDLAEEDRLPDYSQVVGNTTGGRFLAPGWKKHTESGLSHGGSYVSAEPDAKSARFEVKIPTTNDYSVYAWWPKGAGNSTAARFGVESAEGKEWEEVDQRTEGGLWIKVGAYAMEKGERTVEVTAKPSSEGRVVADAVMVVRGEMSMPPDDATTAVDAPAARSTSVDSRASTGPRYGVVRQARSHKGDRYRYATCTASLKSCTCLTQVAVAPYGHRMDMTEIGQWRYRRSVQVNKSRLVPGDELFFKENGARGGITHVGIYSGNGNIVHASSYYGRVVEGKHIRYINGFFGAKRFMFR